MGKKRHEISDAILSPFFLRLPNLGQVVSELKIIKSNNYNLFYLFMWINLGQIFMLEWRCWVIFGGSSNIRMGSYSGNYTKFPAMLCLVELGLEQWEPGRKKKVWNEYPYRLGFLWKMLKKLFKTRILGVEWLYGLGDIVWNWPKAMDGVYVGRANASHERETCKDDRNCRG
jgi:hypothetical protein